MTPQMLPGLLLGLPFAAALPLGDAEGDDTKKPFTFEAPTRLLADGSPMASEAPGYASPAWHDVTGDGRADVIVGQFAGGKMMVYPGLEDGAFGKGQWLEAGGEVAQVPGVW